MSYRRLDAEDIVLSTDSVSTPIWTGNTASLFKENTEIKAQQEGSLSGLYYLDVYNKPSHVSSSISEVQFSITYGDVDGSGSAEYNKSVPGVTYSKTIYGQYRSLVLGDEESSFYLKNSVTASNNFIALVIDRARYKERLMVGSVELLLTNPTTGEDLILTDNSRFGGTVQYVDSGRLYKLVEKSAETDNTTFGFLLPDIGIIMLDCEAIGMDPETTRFSPTAEDTVSPVRSFYDNCWKGLTLQSQETVTSNYVFIRARNAEFNYSTNPSNITGSGELRHNVMIDQPQVYITSVGLYNDSNDLLAVAKLSRPLMKDFTKEAIIRIKIDY